MKSLKKNARRHSLNRTKTDKINQKIAKASATAFKNARNRALRKGLSVVVKIKDTLYRVYPNGQREFIKKVAPDIKIDRKSFEISL